MPASEMFLRHNSEALSSSDPDESEGSRDARARLLVLVTSDFEFVRGSPLPLGATVVRGGVNFSLFAKNTAAITLVIFLPDDAAPFLEFPLDPRFHKTGDVWHCLLSGLDPGIHYGYRVNQGKVLLDPYGKAVWGRPQWGERSDAGLRSVVVDDRFAWEHDQPLAIPLADSVIYEMHVRGFTKHSSSGVHVPGTFLGLTDKIPYLKNLGITAVELLPVVEFDETANVRSDPATGTRLLDYWGYNPLSFFAPKPDYSSAAQPLSAVAEFKEMVQRFHTAGIEVILDVVFNHTGEGSPAGPTISWRGIDDQTYYLQDPQSGQYLDYSGCGNTLNCNHPVVRNQIVDCLHYWVTEMHVDGFRFDLASILGRGRDGNVLANPPLLEQIAGDPILAGTKLIAEAWDAAGLYQVGSFPAWGRWAEWNGKFRDDIRRFIKGDPGMVAALATRLAGSSDLYQNSGRQPFHSINFVTCHDGFTLADMVSYNGKHNQRNGEDDRDGSNDNFSWNCGQEGPATDPEVQKLREQQVRNVAALLLLSHGTPMLLAGDEIGHSQGGNNNAYCQDNELSWMDWRLEDSNQGLLRFFRNLIRFRRAHAILRRDNFVPDTGHRETIMRWGGREPDSPDWSHESRLLSLHLGEAPSDTASEQIYLIANAHWEAAECGLPRLTGSEWRRFADTSLTSPDDIADDGMEAAIPQDRYCVNPRSLLILVSKEIHARRNYIRVG
jgi:isoamylase